MADRQQRQRLRALRNDRQLARFVTEGRATGKQLGTGSYGSVEEIEVNGLICAGKRIHEALIDADNAGIENVARKYVQECQLMSDLRHPNITQFLGICFLPNCQLPVLLMERLDCSLDDLLESVPNIPLVLKHFILGDVSRGLLYLHKHTPQIIHRDLTAKNVLLTSSLVAKITDFGNSRIVNLQPGQLARTLSRLPGTLVYMPPEALEASSRYGPSLDIFSFGHLALFVGLQVFPGDLLQPNYTDPDNPDGLVGRSEVGRRKAYFDQLEDLLPGGVRHHLVQLIKDCLRNAPSQRPTAEQLLTVLNGMKGAVEGPSGELATMDAARQVKTALTMKKEKDQLIAKDQEIQQLQRQLEAANERCETELHQRDEEIQQKNTQLDQIQAEVFQLQQELQQNNAQHIRAIHQLEERQRQREEHLREEVQLKDTELKQKEVQLQLKKEEIQKKNSDISRYQSEIERLQVLLQRAMQHSSAGQIERKTPLAELMLPLKLKWRRGKDMPFRMWGYPNVVEFKEKVYIGGGISSSFGGGENIVVVYDPKQDFYHTLPPYTYKYFSMAVINDQLVLVGGCGVVDYHNKTSKLAVWHEKLKTWIHPFPPMNTACDSPSVATHNNRWLVVMGGTGDKTHLSRVEVLDTTNPMQWYQAASLPQPCHQVSCTTIGNMYYLIGGFTKDDRSKKVFSVCLDDLISISQAVTSSQRASASAPTTPSPWQSLPDTPLDFSTALAFNGALLSVGGERNGSSTIFMCRPGIKQWVKAGELPTKRCDSACIVLPSGEVLVAGGGEGNIRQMIEIASIL